MICPDCSGKSRVIDTRRTDRGWKLRRRICIECGTRWDTYEIPADQVEITEVNDEQVEELGEDVAG